MFLHDHLVAMGADCDNDADKSHKGDLSKNTDLVAMKKSLDEANERIKKLESQPVPTRRAARSPRTNA